jgi:hypothetical protein
MVSLPFFTLEYILYNQRDVYRYIPYLFPKIKGYLTDEKMARKVKGRYYD